MSSAPRRSPADYRPGEQVEVWAFRRWRPGTIVAVGRARIRVEYRTRDGQRAHCNWFPAGLVRPVAAAGLGEEKGGA